MKPLEGKVSLVTGGSRGIGKAIAIALAEAGSHVAVNYFRSDDAAEDVCREVRARGAKSIKFRANVADDEANHQMVESIMSQLGPVNILVNNAGINRDTTFMKMTYDAWREVIDVNLNGQAMVTHEILKRCMYDSGWGRVIFIASVVGQQGNFGQSNYSAAKGALMSLTRTLAREVARKGITVNAVAPGFIETDMTANVPEKALEQVRAVTPVGRLGKPAEVADAVVFLAGPNASYITGEVLNVNGGMWMG